MRKAPTEKELAKAAKEHEKAMAQAAKEAATEEANFEDNLIDLDDIDDDFLDIENL